MKTLKIITIVFSLIGGGLLVGTFLLLHSSLTLVSEGQSVRGTIVSVERRVSHDSDGTSVTYYPVFTFTDANGISHTVASGTGSNPAGYETGEDVTVLYLTDAPSKARIKSFLELWLAPLIVGLLGLLFGGIGFGMAFWHIRKKRRTAWLKVNGQRIEARITGTPLRTNISVNGRHPWVIEAQWQNPVTARIHIFESDYLWFDPASYLKQETVTVLIDAKDPRQYHMDVGFLPQLAE